MIEVVDNVNFHLPVSYQNGEHDGYPYEKEHERLLVDRPAIRIFVHDSHDHPR